MPLTLPYLTFPYLLQAKCPAANPEVGSPDMLYWDPIRVSDIRWNFEKILVDKQGRPRYRFDPHVEPHLLLPFIQELGQEY